MHLKLLILVAICLLKQSVSQLFTETLYIPFKGNEYIVCDPDIPTTPNRGRNLVDQRCNIKIVKDRGGREYRVIFHLPDEPIGSPSTEINANTEICILGRFNDALPDTKLLAWRTQPNPISNFRLVAEPECSLDSPESIWYPVFKPTKEMYLENKANPNVRVYFSGEFLTVKPGTGVSDPIEFLRLQNVQYRQEYFGVSKNQRSIFCATSFGGGRSAPQLLMEQNCILQVGRNRQESIRLISSRDPMVVGAVSEREIFCIEHIFSNGKPRVLWTVTGELNDRNIFGIEGDCNPETNLNAMWRLIDIPGPRTIVIRNMKTGLGLSMPKPEENSVLLAETNLQDPLDIIEKITGGPTPTLKPTFIDNIPSPTEQPTPSVIDGKDCKLLPNGGEGFCRASDNSHDDFKEICSGGNQCAKYLDRRECEKECLNRENCNAYEWDKNDGRCEVHFGNVDQFSKKNGRFCYTCGGTDAGPPDGEDEKKCLTSKIGACRSSHGDFKLICGGENCYVDEDKCRFECKNSLACKAYEWWKNSGRCELHYGKITKVDSSKSNARCAECEGGKIQACRKLVDNNGRNGNCRSGSSSGNFKLLCNGEGCEYSFDKCEGLCLDDKTCKGFEIGVNGKNGWCEIHYDVVDRVSAKNDKQCYSCDGIEREAFEYVALSTFQGVSAGAGVLAFGSGLLVCFSMAKRSSQKRVESVDAVSTVSNDEIEKENPLFNEA